MNSLPRTRLIVDYKSFFNTNPPKDRISIIKFISKKSILCELIALNYRLKPRYQTRINDNFSVQLKELKYFTKTELNYNRYFNIFNNYTKKCRSNYF